jgi:hypothetical protein
LKKIPAADCRRDSFSQGKSNGDRQKWQQFGFWVKTERFVRKKLNFLAKN